MSGFEQIIGNMDSFLALADHPIPPNLLPSIFPEDLDDEDLVAAANQVEARELHFSDVDEEELLRAVDDVEHQVLDA
jgi:hypothetical protein